MQNPDSHIKSPHIDRNKQIETETMKFVNLILLIFAMDLVKGQMFKILHAQARNLRGLLQTLNGRQKTGGRPQRKQHKPGMFIRRH